MIENHAIEGVQYGSGDNVWHAVLPDARLTMCGLNPINANRMWVDWDKVSFDACRRCAASLRKVNPNTSGLT